MSNVALFSIVAASLFALLGAFLVFDPVARRKGFTWLGLFFLLLSLNSLDAAMQFSGTYEQFLFLILWEDPAAMLYGPLIYFFVNHIRTGKAWQPSYWLHVLPFLIAETSIAFMHMHFSPQTKEEILRIMTQRQLSYEVLIGFLPLFLHMMTYLLISRKRLAAYQNRLKNFYSSFTLSWASRVIQLLIIIFATSILSTLVRLSTSSLLQTGALLAVLLVSIILMGQVLLKALRQPVFQEQSVREPVTRLAENEALRLQTELDHHLQTEKSYRRAELTLKDVAHALGTDTRSLSYIINQRIGKNFYDYVNDFRIEDAKRIFSASNDEKLTVLEVMYQVGFNSKSSFNTQFKKKTGLTPSEYRKQHKG